MFEDFQYAEFVNKDGRSVLIRADQISSVEEFGITCLFFLVDDREIEVKGSLKEIKKALEI